MPATDPSFTEGVIVIPDPPPAYSPQDSQEFAGSLPEKKPLGDGEEVFVAVSDAVPNVKLPRSDQVDPFTTAAGLETFGQETPWAGRCSTIIY